METNAQKKIAHTKANAENYIEQMTNLPDKKLAYNLDMVQQQMEMAYKANQGGELELLQLWETQIIEARVIKFDAEQLEELKRNADKHIIQLAQSHTETQLNKMLKQLTASSQKAAENQYTNLVQYYAEVSELIKQAINLIIKHEEKYTIIRKLKKQQKLTAFEKQVLNFNPNWLHEII